MYYGKALESNPGEKFFSQSYDSLWSHRNVPPPFDRVKAAHRESSPDQGLSG